VAPTSPASMFPVSATRFGLILLVLLALIPIRWLVVCSVVEPPSTLVCGGRLVFPPFSHLEVRELTTQQPPPADWDENFPAGWKNTDVAAATKRVFDRIPGTWRPSTDGKLYRQEGFDVLAGGLNKTGWKEIIANETPELKNRTYGHTTFMFSGGERGGPLATYLVSSLARPNFNLWVNSAVKRAVRTGGKVTGVELECLSTGGYSGTVNINPGGGVIFAAGSFGSLKLLLRSRLPFPLLALCQES